MTKSACNDESGVGSDNGSALLSHAISVIFWHATEVMVCPVEYFTLDII